MSEYQTTSHPTKRRKNGRKQTVLVHRLIWEESFGEIPEGYIIHHKNGDKKDNRLDNLELINRSNHAKEHWSRLKVIRYTE